MKNFLKIVFLITFYSCTTESEQSISKYFEGTDLVELKSQKIQINNNDIFFKQILYTDFVDDMLIITDQDSKYALKILDLKTNTLRNFGIKGRGANELHKNVSLFSIDYNKPKKLYINDYPDYVVYLIDSVKLGLDSQFSKVNLPIGENSFIGNAVFANGYLIGNCLKNKFGVNNIASNNFFVEFEYEKGEGYLLNQSSFYGHPSKNKAIYLESYSETMGIIDFDENHLVLNELFKGKNESEQIVQGNRTYLKPTKNSRLGFVNATVSDKSIYTLYSGKEYANGRDAYFNANLVDIVYVFDWNGKPLKKYHLDKKVRTISIDEKNNVLYASTYDESATPYLVKYDL